MGAHIATEVELKLAVLATDLPKMRQALHEMAPRSDCSRSSLTTTYYDTADRRLNGLGLSLRVRETNGRFLQTVKDDGRGEPSLLARGEWEDEIAGAAPDLHAPHSGSKLPEGIGGELEPLFVTAVERERIPVKGAASCIEAAIDEGEIRKIGDGVAEAISEIEIELKEGEPEALFDTALRLLRLAPLHLETRSKSERGYAAVVGKAAAAEPVRAAAVALDPAISVDGALQKIGGACLAHLLRNQPAVLAGDPEGVHQMRIAARRMRAIISNLKKRLPAAERRWVSGELDKLDDALGPARNLDVVAESLLPPARRALPHEPALDELTSAIERARQAAHARVGELIRSPAFTESALRLLRWFEARGWRQGEVGARSDPLSQPIGKLAPRLLDRRLRRAWKRAEGFDRSTAKERHRLRVALKELRYTVELLANLFGPQHVRNFTKPLKALQDDLGYANDVRVAREILGGLSQLEAKKERIARAGVRLLAWHEQAVRKAGQRVGKHLHRLNRTAPFW
jgi:inorganic triphosphatase YgiF